MANVEPELDARISWTQVKYVFIDWRVYLYILISIGNLGVIKCFTLFLPCLFNEVSHSIPLIHLITAPPFIFACFFCLLGGYSSSRRNEHGLHIAFFLLIAILGFISMLIVSEQDKVAMYISGCIACCGLYAAFPILLSWLTKNIGGHTKRALTVCFFIASGQLGGALAFKVSVLHLL